MKHPEARDTMDHIFLGTDFRLAVMEDLQQQSLPEPSVSSSVLFYVIEGPRPVGHVPEKSGISLSFLGGIF